MQTPILVYHQIVLDDAPPDPLGFAIPLRQFRRDMQYLARQGYRTSSLPGVAAPTQPGGDNTKTVCLTFDDGYADFYTHAVPVLAAYGFSATVFLVTDQVGGLSDWDGEHGSPLMDWDQIRELLPAGITFGSHTCTHPRLTQLSQAQALEELAQSRALVEARLGQPCHAVAYPYGASSPLVQGLARQAGYTTGCGLDRGRAGPLNLHRSVCRTGEALFWLAFRLFWISHWMLKFREESQVVQSLRSAKKTLFEG